MAMSQLSPQSTFVLACPPRQEADNKADMKHAPPFNGNKTLGLGNKALHWPSTKQRSVITTVL